MRNDASGTAPVADLLAVLDTDAQGWAVTRSVRDNGHIVDFELIYLNETGSRLLGRARDELVGQRCQELWPDTGYADTLPLYRQVVDCRQPAVHTVRCDRAGGAGRFELWIGPYGDGFIVRFTNEATPNPDRSPSHRASHLYGALDAAFDGFALLRARRDNKAQITDFTCEYINQVGAKLIGRTAEEVMGRRLSEISSGSMASGLLDRYREVADGEPAYRQEIASPNGDQVWEVRIARLEAGFIAVSFREITELVRQQERTASSATRAREAGERVTALQTVTSALVTASTSADVYAAMGSVVRPSAGGRGIVVLLRENDRLVLRYHAGYEDDVVEQLRDLPLSHPYPATEVSITGRPRYLRSPAEFATAQPDPGTAVSGGGRQAWAFLPLSSGGDVLGALVIGYAEPREFDEEERANLAAFSGLCAQALQRALLVEARLSMAATLQHALLPATLPRLAGARHAVRYLPWTRGADIGGDWYDLIPLEPDAVAVVIGDVVGHSAVAAARMGQIRNALRAYAVEGHTPGGVIERANQLLLQLAPDVVVTCCYLELHLAEGTATAVLAGHPPPVLRTNGDACPMSLPTGPPLGVVDGATFLESSFLLPTGCNLLLYTDGLVEDRRYDISLGLTELCAAVRAAPSTDPETLVDHILSSGVGPHPRSDDVAILSLAVDTRPPARPRTARRRFRGDAACAAAARRFAADILTAWGQGQLVEDACLLLDEVFTNAVQHTVGDVRVQLSLDDRLRVEVQDHSDRRPGRLPVRTDSEMGRGLQIVEVLALRWGFQPLTEGGKVVWFELPR